MQKRVPARNGGGCAALLAALALLLLLLTLPELPWTWEQHGEHAGDRKRPPPAAATHTRGSGRRGVRRHRAAVTVYRVCGCLPRRPDQRYKASLHRASPRLSCHLPLPLSLRSARHPALPSAHLRLPSLLPLPCSVLLYTSACPLPCSALCTPLPASTHVPYLHPILLSAYLYLPPLMSLTFTLFSSLHTSLTLLALLHTSTCPFTLFPPLPDSLALPSAHIYLPIYPSSTSAHICLISWLSLLHTSVSPFTALLSTDLCLPSIVSLP